MLLLLHETTTLTLSRQIEVAKSGWSHFFKTIKMESSKSLFKLVNGLRFFGVGTRVKRSNFNFPNSYWVLTRVKLSPDQKHGKAYG
eukprot:gene16811-19163_t